MVMREGGSGDDDRGSEMFDDQDQGENGDEGGDCGEDDDSFDSGDEADIKLM